MNHAAKLLDIDDGVARLVDGHITINIRLAPFPMTLEQVMDGAKGSKSSSRWTVEWKVAGKHSISTLHVLLLANDLCNVVADDDIGTTSLEF